MNDDTQLVLVDGEIVDLPEKPKYYMSDKAIAQRKAAAQASALAKLENTDRIEYLAKVAEIGMRRRQKGDDPEDFLEAFREYLILSAEMGAKIGNMSAYMAMGIDHANIERWQDGTARKNDPRYRQVADYVKSVCSAHREMMALDGKVHPALSIFWQRNFDGLTNEDIVKVEHSDALGELRNTDEIRDKYKDMPDD